jgi:hypothetical protein
MFGLKQGRQLATSIPIPSLEYNPPLTWVVWMTVLRKKRNSRPPGFFPSRQKASSGP